MKIANLSVEILQGKECHGPCGGRKKRFLIKQNIRGVGDIANTESRSMGILGGSANSVVRLSIDGWASERVDRLKGAEDTVMKSDSKKIFIE